MDVSEKRIVVHEIGEVIFRRSHRARRVSIRISPSGEVRVTVPFRSSWDTAHRFLHEKKGWVKRTLKKISENAPVPRHFKPGRNPFTRFHDLVLRPDPNTQYSFRLHIEEHTAYLDYPKGIPVSDPRMQQALQESYIRILRQEAREILIPRLEHLARQHGYTYRKVTLKNLRSRWGSCSAAGNINLNIHLMELPDPLIDYVLLHELAHTRHKNHGPAFWEELQRTTGQARELDRELSRYRIRTHP